MDCLCFAKVLLTQLFQKLYLSHIHYPMLVDFPERVLQYHSHFQRQLKEKTPFKTTKNFIRTMDIFSLLNTDLGNLNRQSFILQDDCLSMCNTVYIIVKATFTFDGKRKTYFLIKTKAFFQNQRFRYSAKRRFSGHISKNIIKLVIPDSRP